MNARAEELEREIESVREDLAATIEAIERKVSPRRVFEGHRPMLVAMAGGIVALMTVLVVRKARSHR